MTVASVGDGFVGLCEAGMVMQPPRAAVAETTQISSKNSLVFLQSLYFHEKTRFLEICMVSVTVALITYWLRPQRLASGT